MSVSSLANAGIDIYMFDAEALVAALDDSGDLPNGRGMEFFPDLMIMKYMEIPPRLHDDLNVMGIEMPVLIEVEETRWRFVDGHHRLAWALVHGQPVPTVLFTEEMDPIVLYDALSQFDIFYDYA